jgi:hypothetical protein
LIVGFQRTAKLAAPMNAQAKYSPALPVVYSGETA